LDPPTLVLADYCLFWVTVTGNRREILAGANREEDPVNTGTPVFDAYTVVIKSHLTRK